jgi:hypothetical protein
MNDGRVFTFTVPIANEAADEIERLRAALALAVGELSTYGEYASMSPESLLTNFLKIADNQQLLVKEST